MGLPVPLEGAVAAVATDGEAMARGVVPEKRPEQRHGARHGKEPDFPVRGNASGRADQISGSDRRERPVERSRRQPWLELSC